MSAGAARAVPPHPSNRGGTRYIPRYLASGADTVKEAFDVIVRHEVWTMLERAKDDAGALDTAGDALVPVGIGNELLQVAAHGRRGSTYLLGNDDMTVTVGGRGKDWTVVIEYRSSALWLHGVDAMIQRGRALAQALGTPKSADWVRLSAVHWAFDFESPDLTAEMVASLYEAWVCLSGVKLAMHGVGSRVETMTVGSKASLQIQVYDKGREIAEHSGKTWMADIYADAGNPVDALSDIWRVEVRCSGAWLRDREIKTWEEFCAARAALLCGALESRRLCDPTEDTNRARWPLHPLWAACIAAAGATDDRIPRGRYVTGRRSELLATAVCGIAGYLRAAMVLDVGGEDEQTLSELAQQCVQRALADPDAHKKLEKVMERYRYVDSAA